MKLIITTAAAALLSTAAFADLSTKQADQRLDTSNGQMSFSTLANDADTGSLEGSARAQSGFEQPKDMNTGTPTTFSTRNELASPGQGYPYGGYGVGNDSR